MSDYIVKVINGAIVEIDDNNQVVRVTNAGVIVQASTPGPQGPAGNGILNGEGAPSNTLGMNGDFYIDTEAEDLYGPKAGGAWPAGVSLIGPTGPQGPAGPPGPPGPPGESYSVSFTNQTELAVNHNLNKYPAVTFNDSAGTDYDVSVFYNSLDTCTVSWVTPRTGTITCT